MEWTTSSHGNVIRTACGVDYQWSWKCGKDLTWAGVLKYGGHCTLTGMKCDRMYTCNDIGYLHCLAQGNVTKIHKFYASGLCQKMVPVFGLHALPVLVPTLVHNRQLFFQCNTCIGLIQSAKGERLVRNIVLIQSPKESRS